MPGEPSRWSTGAHAGVLAGGSTWRVRYAPPIPGTYHIRSACSDTQNKDLHDRVSELNVLPYTGTNSHYKHGGLKVA